MAVFTDMMLYGLVVPMLPYVLSDRIGIAQGNVQRWNSILLGSFGGALMLGSCKICVSSIILYAIAVAALLSELFSLCSVFHCTGPCPCTKTKPADTK